MRYAQGGGLTDAGRAARERIRLQATEGFKGGERTLVKRDIGNLAAADLSQITRAVKHRLKQIQHHPDLVDGCLSGTGLTMDS
ncbi:hypothetical protein AB8A21_05455 [Streptomyces sp. BF23-18]|uniref:hypothetical protein n=1 Tax=Streptomyces sp. BF23-18 TaxID=3240282 RepID=UPI0034E59D19